jgi:hypothetical protein
MAPHKERHCGGRLNLENDKLEFFFLGANEVNVVWLFLFVYIDLFIYLFGLT